ncbi:MAG TPA: hypothetical protein VLB69_10270, partial [Rudaea sp.]|nr:hypothetical protein [Rudaea sp.]
MANPEDNEWQSALDAIDLSAIESLKKLKLEQDVLDERLKAMEDLKAEVAGAVYLRVREDYRKRQTSLDEQSRPLKQAARDQYARLRTLLARFEADHEAVKLDQQELELRHKLGEFDDKEFAKRIKAIESSVKDKAEARARALDLKARFLEAFHAESELEGETTPVPRGKADSATTQQFSALTAAELAEARTSEVPKV